VGRGALEDMEFFDYWGDGGDDLACGGTGSNDGNSFGSEVDGMVPVCCVELGAGEERGTRDGGSFGTVELTDTGDEDGGGVEVFDVVTDYADVPEEVGVAPMGRFDEGAELGRFFEGVVVRDGIVVTANFVLGRVATGPVFGLSLVWAHHSWNRYGVLGLRFKVVLPCLGNHETL
jgi:hypothetical protein